MDPKTAVASAYCDTVKKIANDFGSCPRLKKHETGTDFYQKDSLLGIPNRR